MNKEVTELPVLIVGAGPVGLTAASLLSYHDIPVRIIDKKPEPTQTSNAIAINARTLELLTPLNITEILIKKGRLVHHANIFSNKKLIAEWDFSFVDSVYNYMLMLPQSETEKTLITYLESKGVTVERSVEITEVTQEQQDVIATVARANTTEQIKAQWLIACDGYHSAIRKAVHADFPGSDMELEFLMIDAPITGGYTKNINICFNKDHSFVMFPLPESVRMIAEVSKMDKYRQVVQPDEKIFSEISKQNIPHEIKIDKPLWTSKFTIHEHLINQYRFNRIFFAGDAAHVHSPAGGQGMNTGMQDACNLSWKLALVIKGIANPEILDSYNAERRPAAQHLLNLSEQLTKLGTTHNKFVTYLRDHLLSFATKFEAVQKKFAFELAQLDINYQNSEVVAGNKTSKLSPGDRAPHVIFIENNQKVPLLHKIAGKHHVLLNFSNDSSIDFILKKYSNQIKVVPVSKDQTDIRKKFGISEKGYCLIRPDQYIAFIGNNSVDLEGYLKKIFVHK